MNILKTQDDLIALEREHRELTARLETVKKQLALAIENHRLQIAASLRSLDPIERELAEGVREWYDVPPVA